MFNKQVNFLFVGVQNRKHVVNISIRHFNGLHAKCWTLSTKMWTFGASGGQGGGSAIAPRAPPWLRVWEGVQFSKAVLLKVVGGGAFSSMAKKGTFFCDGKKEGGGGYNFYLLRFHPPDWGGGDSL